MSTTFLSTIVFNLTLVFGVLLTPISASAAQDTSVKITTQAVAPNLYMLTGKGGNIGLSIGANGPLLIDDQYAPQSPAILAAIAELSKQPVKFVINTHWHGDHTGGNENLGKLGAIIVAHENVRKAMSKEQFLALFDAHFPPAKEIAKPVITFTESITFHWNKETIQVDHVKPSHTDGDSIIYFTQANVIHAGDVFFNKIYPFIDVSTGGSIRGMISAANYILGIADEKTKIIPGHGPLATKQDLANYIEMLEAMCDRITDLKAAGKTRDQVIAAKPTHDFDSIWGQGFLQPDSWVGIVYDSI